MDSLGKLIMWHHAIFVLAILLIPVSPALAQETSGGFAMGSIKVGYDNRTCNSGLSGSIRFNSATSCAEYCNGTAWTCPSSGTACGGPADCLTVGSVCSDGSVFAGCTAPTDTPMFATRCDAGQTWSGSACTGTRITRAWNNGNTTGYTTAGTTSLTAGETSTTTLVATDSDSGVAGTQAHLAAAYCDSLSIHSKTDWYVPSQAELYLMWAKQSTIGTQDIANFTAALYWTSTEVWWDPNPDPIGSNAWAVDFDTSSNVIFNNRTKDDANYLRCVRR